MALIYDPSLISAANGTSLTPYAIDREWCLGDSLFFINRNFNNLDTRTTTLESRFPIANANVSNTAAIAGTKISPNFGSAQVLTTGNITGGSISTGGNITSGSINAAGTISATGQIYSGNSFSTPGTISATGQIYSASYLSTAGYVYANGLVYAGNNKVQIGGGGLGGDSAGYILFNVPGYGLSRYLGGWSWWDGLGTRVGIATNGDMYVGGTALLGALITSGYKSFLIDHPVKPNHSLLHICPESPTPDLIYHGVVKLVAGRAKINIDATYNITPGTINAIANNLVVTFLQNQDSFNRLKPTPVVNGEFEIICEDLNSTDNVSWVVIGTRKDIPLPKIEIPKP